jgi:hypothetical protein
MTFDASYMMMDTESYKTRTEATAAIIREVNHFADRIGVAATL